MIRFDDATGNGTRGSGVLRKHDTSAFLLSKFTGSYVYAYQGRDLLAARIVEVGVFQLDGLGTLVGTGDSNHAGSLESITLTGSYAPIDYTTGSAASAVDHGTGPINYITYVISTSELLIMSVDPVSQAQILLAGTIHQQVGNGSFSISSLDGAGVLYATALGVNQGNLFGITTAGLATADGLGSMTLDAWENDYGDFTHHQGGGTYAVAGNGRVTFTGDIFPPVAYLINQNQGVESGSPSGCFGLS